MESRGGVLLQRDGARLNKLVGNAITYPGIVEDYKKTFQAARGIIADVFLAPHPEMFKMEDKRPLIGKYGVNPFVKAGEFHAYLRDVRKSVRGRPRQAEGRSRGRQVALRYRPATFRLPNVVHKVGIRRAGSPLYCEFYAN